MGWFILVHVFTTWLSIISIARLSDQEKELEILVLRHQLAILRRKCDKPVKPNRIEKLSLAVLTVRLKQITRKSATRDPPFSRYRPHTLGHSDSQSGAHPLPGNLQSVLIVICTGRSLLIRNPLSGKAVIPNGELAREQNDYAILVYVPDAVKFQSYPMRAVSSAIRLV